MNQEQMTLLLIKGAITDLSEEDQTKVKAAADEFREVLSRRGDEAKLAFALIVAELAAEA